MNTQPDGERGDRGVPTENPEPAMSGQPVAGSRPAMGGETGEDTSPLGRVTWTMRDVARVTLVVVLAWGLLILLMSLVPMSIRVSFSGSTALLAMFTLFYGTMILATWLFGLRPRGMPFRELGYRPFPVARSVLPTFGWWLVVIFTQVLLTTVVLWVTGRVPSSGDAVRLVEMFGQGGGALARALVGAVVIAPVAEETFFRGFLYPVFRNRYGVMPAIWITACIFAIVHLSWWKFFAVLIMGAVLAHLYEKRGSLGPPIMLHALTNLVSVILIYTNFGG